MVVAEGDHVVQYGIREGYWPGGSFRGVQIPAGDYTREVAFMYRLEGGRIAERWAVRDDLGMMQQLGADIRSASRARPGRPLAAQGDGAGSA
jgi:predicted ester cyclase